MIDQTLLLFSFLASSLFLAGSVYLVKNKWAWASLGLLHVSLFINSGVAVAYYDVPGWFAWYHFIFLITCTASFIFVWKLSGRFATALGLRVNCAEAFCAQKGFFMWVLGLYSLALLSALVYPDFRLLSLFDLRPPDITTWFLSRFEPVERGGLEAIVRYIKLLLFPFIFVALYRLKQKPIILISFIISTLYIQYVDSQYLARGAVLLYMLTISLYYFVEFPSTRRKIIFTGVVATPVIFVLLEYWMVVRLGGDYEYKGVWPSLERILIMQTSFTRDAGLIIIESGKHVDLAKYFTWLFTLPIPKALIGQIDGARVNYEISEIVLGVARGAPGFYVILGGVVAESVYIFGEHLFWLHALFLGGFSAALIRILSSVRYLGLLTAWTVVFFAYKMPGAGIGATLPPLINEYLLFYIFIGYAAYRYSGSQRARLNFINSTYSNKSLLTHCRQKEGSQ